MSLSVSPGHRGCQASGRTDVLGDMSVPTRVWSELHHERSVAARSLGLAAAMAPIGSPERLSLSPPPP
jgi:hypothetical protein